MFITIIDWLTKEVLVRTILIAASELQGLDKGVASLIMYGSEIPQP